MISCRPFDICRDKDLVVKALFDTKIMIGELPEDPVKDGNDLIEAISLSQKLNIHFAEKYGFHISNQKDDKHYKMRKKI